MTFRDDRDALLARADALDPEAERRRRDDRNPSVSQEKARVLGGAGGGSIRGDGRRGGAAAVESLG
jgi:hypothetical protein